MTQLSNTPKTHRIPKKQRAMELYTQFHHLPRAEMINKLVSELGLKVNSAETYLSTCSKALNASLGKEFKTRRVNHGNLIRERAFAIYETYAATLSRAEIIGIIVKEIPETTAKSAATYCSQAIQARKARENGCSN